MFFFPFILISHSFLFLCLSFVLYFLLLFYALLYVQHKGHRYGTHTALDLSASKWEKCVFTIQCDGSMWLLCSAGDKEMELISPTWVWSGSLAFDAGTGVLDMWQGRGQGNGMPRSLFWEVRGSIVITMTEDRPKIQGWKAWGYLNLLRGRPLGQLGGTCAYSRLCSVGSDECLTVIMCLYEQVPR